MKKWLLMGCAIAFIMSGCVTAPPSEAVLSTVTPNIIGPESGYTGTGDPGAHDWTDDDARTLLWLRRNLPERWAAAPFTLLTLLSYNIHHDTRQYMPWEWSYYFADPTDPYLNVRMLTLEARDRNRIRRDEVLARKAAEEAAAEKAITGDVSELTDQEVVKKLETIFP
jgi:hypothetical protein